MAAVVFLDRDGVINQDSLNISSTRLNFILFQAAAGPLQG